MMSVLFQNKSAPRYRRLRVVVLNVDGGLTL